MSEAGWFIPVQTSIHKDEKVLVCAEVGGYNRYEAIGRLHALWSWCLDRRLKDAPADCDGYAVADHVVRRFLGPNGVTAILGDGCDDFALAERRPDGLLYLRGTSETVARLRARRGVAQAGGRARAAAERDEDGRFVPQTTDVQLASSREPAASQPSPAEAPAEAPAGSQPQPAIVTVTDTVTDQREESRIASRTRRVRREPSGPFQEAMDHFDRRYEARERVRYQWFRRDFKPLSELVKDWGRDEVVRRMDLLFDGHGPEWLKPPFTVGTLVSQWNSLATATDQRAGPSRTSSHQPTDGIRPTRLL